MKRFLLTLCALALIASCKSQYEKGYDAGFDQGHQEGFDETYDQGFADGEAYGYQNGYASGEAQGYQDGHASGYGDARTDYASPEYENGYSEGHAYGYDLGYGQGDPDGYADGKVDGHADGFQDGYTVGYNQGHAQGDADGYDEGYDDWYYDGLYDGREDGYNVGYADGYDDGYDHSYDDGFDDGYSDGYGDGYNAGYGSSVAKSDNPLVKLASNVNKDLVDYSKIKAFSKNDIESGTIVFSHSEGSIVDMEKLAALKEKHYLNQISRQLMGRFGLSSESASNVATVIHQYNKVAGSRALTEQDAQGFSRALVGFDLVQIEAAVKKSMKGDSKDFNELINKASEKIGTSPENFNRMIKQIFY